jgi:hypothetical protein
MLVGAVWRNGHHRPGVNGLSFKAVIHDHHQNLAGDPETIVADGKIRFGPGRVSLMCEFGRQKLSLSRSDDDQLISS